MADRMITSPEHIETVAETIASLLDGNGFDAEEAMNATGDQATTEFRDPVTGVVFELSIRPLRIERPAETVVADGRGGWVASSSHGKF